MLEAARIDGASDWTRFWRVTVPLLSPTIFFAVVVGTIYAFQSFGADRHPHRLPERGLRLHVNVLIYNIVNTLPVEQQPGRGRRHVDRPVPITLVLTLLQLRLLERRVHYGR